MSTIFGSTFGDPESNGGRLFYDNGIDVSNAISIGAKERVQYTVQIAATAADTKAFWAKVVLGQHTIIPGNWKRAASLLDGHDPFQVVE